MDPQVEAVPFYRSPVFLMIVTALLTRAAVALPILSQWVGLTSTTISTYSGAVILAVGGAFDWFALRARKNSKLQPLTLTQAKADAKNTGQSGFIEPRAACGLALIAFGLLTACATLFPTGAQTFNEKLDAAIQTDKGVYQIADTLYVAKIISKADTQNVVAQADNLTAALDVARSLHATDPTAGQSKLDTTVLAVNALLAYLNSRQPAGAPTK